MTGSMAVSRKRLQIIFIILVALMVCLIIRVGYWNIIEGEWLQSQAQSQWISDSKIMPKRGTIFDRNMNILAQSAAADTVAVVPEQVKDEDAEYVANALAQILEMDKNALKEKITTKVRKLEDGTEKKIGEVWLKRQISVEQSEAIKALKEQKESGAKMKGVKLVSDVKRYYPNKEFATQLIGYTDLDGVGQTGIEKRYNSVLEGRQGRMVAEQDTHNNDIPNGQELFIAPVNGQNVILTIDEVVQSFLEAQCKAALDETAAEGVQGLVMSVNTGEVLAMANLPEFDLNAPPRSDGETLSALSSNIVTAKAYEPGGIFSVFTAAAAMDTDVAKQTYECTGAATVDGEKIICSAVHGSQSFEVAAANGCVIAASQMAVDTGIVPFYNYLSRFGFGEKTGIDFSADTKGDVMAKKYASERDIAKMGAGQELTASLLQLTNALTSIANGGKLYVPRLVSGLSDENGNITESYGMQVKGQSVDEGTAAAIRDILVANTAGVESGQLEDYTNAILYGASNKYDDRGALVVGKDNSTFLGFAPANDPQYIVLLHLDGVEEGSSTAGMAVPYGNKVLEDTLKFYLAQPDKQGAQPQTTGEGDDTGEQLIEVPNLVDMGSKAAIELLTDAGLNYKDDGSGTVVGQQPSAGEMVAPGTVVNLEMDFKRQEATPEAGLATPGEAGVDVVTVPDFSGLSLKEARDLAISAGLKFYAHGTGRANSQYPDVGTSVQRGSAVSVNFKLELPG